MEKTLLDARFPSLDEVASWYGITAQERKVLDEMARRDMKRPLASDRLRRKSVASKRRPGKKLLRKPA